MSASGMQYNFLGRSGLRVSSLCLGAMTFGTAGEASTGSMAWFFNHARQLDEAASHAVLDKFVELGGNFIDTANMYAYGNSERVIGTWLQARENRDDMIIATKARFPVGDKGQNGSGLSRRHLVEACEASLKRLQTDYIDLYQCHMWDNGTPIDETLRALDDLVRAGKIRYYGFSNVCGWQLQKIVDTTKELGLNRCVSLQQQYSLLSRDSELEAFMVCQSEGIGVLPWGPLKGGLLTGKFERDTVPSATDSRAGMVYERTKQSATSNWGKHAHDDKYWALIDTLKDIAKTHEKTVAQVALRWLLQKHVVASVIIGVSSLAQLESNMAAAAGWELAKDEMERLDAAYSPARDYPYDMIWNQSNTSRHNPYNPDSMAF